METQKTVVSENEKELQDYENIETNTKELIKLLTLNRDRTKEERLKYIAYRDKQNEQLTRKERKQLRKSKKIQNREFRSYQKNKSEVITSTRERVVGITNIHHLVPKSLNGSNDAENMYRMLISAHQGLNAFIGNKYLHKIIIQMLNMHKPTMHHEYRNEIIYGIVGLMKKYIEEGKFYNEKCFRNPNFIPKSL